MAAFKLQNRVWETSTTTGTGALTLAGAVSGYLTFANQYADTDEFIYFAVNQAAPTTEWEWGIGVFNSGAGTITRKRVIKSTNSNAAVNFAAGTKDVFVDLPGELVVEGLGVVLALPAASP